MPLQPYFTDKVKITVTSDISTRGTLTVEANADRTLGVGFTGDTTLADLATLDKDESEDFLKWNSLSIQGINAGNSPPHADINAIALSNFYSRLIVNADGSLNVQDIMIPTPTHEPSLPEPAGTAQATTAPPTQTAAAPPAQPARVTIGAITMERGSIDSSDRFIKPNYSAKLAEMSGKISGLSSEESRTGDVDIRAKLGSGAPLTISGKINPLGNDLFVDIHGGFQGYRTGPDDAVFGANMPAMRLRRASSRSTQVSHRQTHGQGPEQSAAGSVHVRREGGQPDRDKITRALRNLAIKGSAMGSSISTFR